MNSAHLLVRTPVQHPLESPAGYLLRVSEANGYGTPKSLLTFADMDRDEAFTTRFNTEKLAVVLGVRPNQLHGYQSRGSNVAAMPALCGLQVMHRDLVITCSRLCPQCIAELGFVPAWFDLSAVDACPTHMRSLVSVCMECKQCMGSLRPGLLTCRCRADLSGALGEPIEADHAELLTWVVSKFTDRPSSEKHGMPTEWLGAMSLERLLRVIGSLASLHAAATRQSGATDLQRSARLLSRWPENFYVAMAALMPADVDGNGAQLMRANAESVYRTWVANMSSASDMAFVRNVLAEFDPAKPPGLVQSLLVSVIPPAPRPPETQKWKRSRGQDKLTRADQSDRSDGRAGQYMQVRVAAKHIGLPVSVLRFLHRTGALGLGSTRRSVLSKAALLHIEGQVEALQILPPGADAVQISLMAVLRRKFGYIDGKGELVAAVLNGTISVIGRVGPGFAGLNVDANQAATFIARARSAGYAGTLSSAAAAERINCAPTVIDDLCAQGLLAGRTYATGLRILEDSASAFIQQFRSLASISKEHGTSARNLLAMASSTNAPLVFARRSCTGKSQAFLRVKDLDLLVAALDASRRLPQSVLIGDSITFQVAADALECTPTVVPRLIELGYLAIHECVAGRRVAKATVDRFLALFRSVAYIARQHGVGPARILNEAASLGIDLLAVERGNKASPQYFMKVQDSVKLAGPYETKAAARLRKSLAAKARRRIKDE